MGFRQKYNQNSVITARQTAARRVSKSTLIRYLLSTFLVGAYLLFTYYAYYDLAISILKDPFLTYIVLGIGVAGGYTLMLRLGNPPPKQMLKDAPKEPQPTPPEINELKNTKDKLKIPLPLFALKKRGYGKKQSSKPTLFSKIKNWFSLSNWQKKPVPLKQQVNDSVLETESSDTEECNEKQPPSIEIKEQDPTSILVNKVHSFQKRRKKRTSTRAIFSSMTPPIWVPPEKESKEPATSEEESTSEEETKIPFTPTLFKATDNKNVYVNKERLPSAFIQFSELVNQLTQKNLTLTGGALTSLLLGSNQFNDLDCIIFENQKHLFKLLSEAKQDTIQYSCREVSKKNPIIKVILAEQYVPPCELIYLPHSTQTSFLDFPMTSSAAYIRTRNSLFYVNKMNNTCIEIKCHDSVEKTSLCNISMLKLFDKTMHLKNQTKSIPLSLHELYDITSITNHAHAKLIEVDIKGCPSYEGILENAIKANMKQRDFKLSALYSNVLPGYDTILIKGFDGAISSVNHHIISAVNPDTLFKKPEDLPCIFRLANIMLKHREFKCDQPLQDLLKTPILSTLFDEILFAPAKNTDHIIHLAQINTKLNKLFSHFNAESVIKTLCELNVISAMTGIENNAFLLDTASNFANYINTVPNHYKKTAFYYFIYMHFCLSSPDDNNNYKMSFLMEKVKKTLEPDVEAPEFEKHLNYIKEHSFKQSASSTSIPFTPDPAFSEMFFEIKFKLLNKTIHSTMQM